MFSICSKILQKGLLSRQDARNCEIIFKRYTYFYKRSDILSARCVLYETIRI